MTIVIITSYVLSALSGLCNLVPSLLYVLPTQMWDVLKKCDVFQKAMQLSVHDQCGALVKIKYRKEFRSPSTYFVSCTLWIISRLSVFLCNA